MKQTNRQSPRCDKYDTPTLARIDIFAEHGFGHSTAIDTMVESEEEW